MEIKQAIEKVLDAINDDPRIAEGMEKDTEGTLRELVGNEVSEQDLANLTKGTSRIFSDKTIAALFLKLLKKKANRSGLVKLLLKVGGVSLLLKLLGKGDKEDDGASVLSTLLGSEAGVNMLLNLIGKKADEIPALTSILGMVTGGSGKKTGLLAKLLKSLIK